MIGALKHALRRFGPGYRALNRARGVRLHRSERGGPAIDVLGSDYGGWGVDLASLGPASVVYSVGVGEDLSFDLELIRRAGCQVFAFDPTPRSVAWVERQELPPQLRFMPIGLGAEDGETTFYEPADEAYVSFSRSGGEGRAGVRCPIHRLGTLMSQLGHDRLDLLKMDIEGFEYEVLDDLVASGIRPHQLLVEFHHGMYGHSPDQTRQAVERLRDCGYAIAWISDLGREYNFRLASSEARPSADRANDSRNRRPGVGFPAPRP